MIDLSANKEVKQLCMWLCGDRSHHNSNLSRIDWNIQRRYTSQNIPINWKTVQSDCNELVRLYIEEYTRLTKAPALAFRLRDKIGMASNMVEHFKMKYGAVPEEDYLLKLLRKIGDDV